MVGLLRQLVLPEALDSMQLTVFNPTVEDILQTLVSYVQDRFRRDARFQHKLHVSSVTYPNSISISVRAVWVHYPTPSPTLPSVTVSMVLPLPDVTEQLLIGLIAPIPGDNVI